MTQVTAAQKARLGLFVLSALVLFLLTLAFLIGAQLLQERDDYTIIFNAVSYTHLRAHRD